MPNVVMPSVVMPSVVMQNVVMLRVAAPAIMIQQMIENIKEFFFKSFKEIPAQVTFYCCNLSPIAIG